MITRYDQESFDIFNWSALTTLFLSLFSVKLITSSLLQGKYILPSSELKTYFISLGILMTGSLIFIYKGKKNLDDSLDLKYSPILKSAETKNKLTKKI
jgi:hypothetical protein